MEYTLAIMDFALFICLYVGLIFSGGHMWRHQRRFALATLKYFGVGKKTLENSILQECLFVCSSFQTKQGQSTISAWIHTSEQTTSTYCSLQAKIWKYGL